LLSGDPLPLYKAAKSPVTSLLQSLLDDPLKHYTLKQRQPQKPKVIPLLFESSAKLDRNRNCSVLSMIARLDCLPKKLREHMLNGNGFADLSFKFSVIGGIAALFFALAVMTVKDRISA
jgi:hypothetical protein